MGVSFCSFFRGKRGGKRRGKGEGPYLEHSVLRLDGNDLVPDELEDAIDDGFETLQDFLVRERHVAFFDTGVWEFGLDADVDGPFLAIVPEIGFDAVFEVHDAFRIHFPRRLRPVRKFHFADLGTQDVAEIAVECCRAARVAGACGALGHGERCFFFDFVGDQVDRSATTVDDENCVAYFEV